MSQWPKDLRIYEIYPQGKTSFVEYDDDGTTEAYREGYSTVTRISSEQEGDKVTVTIEPTEGMYDGMVKERVTELRINVTQAPKQEERQATGRFFPRGIRAGYRCLLLRGIAGTEPLRDTRFRFRFRTDPEESGGTRQAPCGRCDR